MAEATTRYDEEARWEAFLEGSRAWHDVRRHREFLAAARTAVARFDGPARQALDGQLDFAARRVDALDPLADPGRLVPRVRPPKPEDLKPYLGRWSPHGPDVSW